MNVKSKSYDEQIVELERKIDSLYRDMAFGKSTIQAHAQIDELEAARARLRTERPAGK